MTTSVLMLLLIAIGVTLGTATAEAQDDWTPLFDGKSLTGWRAAEHPDSWTVQDGCLVARGERSHLFYVGPVGDHDFRNFEVRVEVSAEANANSGVYFHTEFQESGWPSKGCEVQINNTYGGRNNYTELKRTGSLYAIRNIAKQFIGDGEWFQMRVTVVGKRVRIHVNDELTVDYVQPDKPRRKKGREQQLVSHGTLALQGHDPGSVVRFRRVDIRLLPEDVDPTQPPRASTEGYDVSAEEMDTIAASYLPFVDYHLHLRGGMSLEKALARQAVTGINVGVLRNLGQGWPLETDEQLKAFLDEVTGKPAFVGVQVNDRDWFTKHSPELLKRLDYVLADTMIMPMPTDDSPPVKLWMPDLYTLDDGQAWMERYVRHNLRVLSEPISILANPTYLPPAVQDRYDELWTDARMLQVIEAAIKNNVALEIPATSQYPHDRFIRLAKAKGAKFAFGSNNFDDKPLSMRRCVESLTKYGLVKADMFVPQPKP